MIKNNYKVKRIILKKMRIKKITVNRGEVKKKGNK